MGLKLSSSDMEERLKSLPNWWIASEKLQRSFVFRDFKHAMAFVNQVAELAESINHHPDIYISYSRVQFELSTHEVGGLTQKDFQLAALINGLMF
jgi:4a-hydroxytetrahydrobiopterin dehydratase